MFALLFAGAAAAALVAAPVPVDVTELSRSVVTATRSSEVKLMPGWGSWQTFGELRCPADAPRLDGRHYSNGSQVPDGIEVAASGDGVDVFAVPLVDPDLKGRPFGLAFATTTNWKVPTTPRTVQLVIHCASTLG